MRTAHHLVQTLSPGDAISGHALALTRLLRHKGYDSRVYAERLHPHALCLGLPVAHLEHEPPPGPDDLLFYHYSLDSDLTEVFESFPGKRILVYHNVTPESYLVGHHPELVELLARGRETLARLSDVPYHSLADSELNRRELLELGFASADVLPILLDLTRLHVPSHPAAARSLARAQGTTVLFVGRVIPNKGHDSLLRCFAAYQRLFDPLARLLVVGEYRSIESYNHELLRIAEAAGLRDVSFLGHVSDAELAACYRAADLFVCMSRHEGFCVPLLEAFSFGVPVVALARAAVPDTCGEAAVLVDEDDPLLVAGLMDALSRGGPLRERVIERQRARLADYSEERIAALFYEQLARIEAPVPAGAAP
jgi:L-malate glycosyltransferase